MGPFKSRVLIAQSSDHLFRNVAFFRVQDYTPCAGCVVLYPEEGSIAETSTKTLVTASILQFSS